MVWMTHFYIVCRVLIYENGETLTFCPHQGRAIITVNYYLLLLINNVIIIMFLPEAKLFLPAVDLNLARAGTRPLLPQISVKACQIQQLS